MHIAKVLRFQEAKQHFLIMAQWAFQSHMLWPIFYSHILW